MSSADSPADSPAEQWRLAVADDGASVTVHAPDAAVITAMTSRSITIALATGPGAASRGEPGAAGKPTPVSTVQSGPWS